MTTTFSAVTLAPILPFGLPQSPGATHASLVSDAPTLAPGPTAQSSTAMSGGATDPLTLAQYAALCAELAAFPAATEETFRRYGLASRDDRSRIDQAWQERLRQNPSEYQTWQALSRQYHAHYLSQGRSEMKP